MPIVSRETMEHEITHEDVLLVNAGFSRFLFGWRLRGFKIGYIQGFAQFNLLDRRLNHYVAVSDVVARYLAAVYDIDARVIPPFIDVSGAPAPRPWQERPVNVVLPYRKGVLDVWDVSFRRLREIVAARAPEITLAEPLERRMPHADLLARIAAVRYLLVLSAAEGFGLVPKNRIMWLRQHGLHATRKFSCRHETILWFTKTNNHIFNLDAIRVR